MDFLSDIALGYYKQILYEIQVYNFVWTYAYFLSQKYIGVKWCNGKCMCYFLLSC